MCSSSVPSPSTNYDDFAEIYDSQYANYHAISGDIQFYNHYAASARTPVLDLGCGTGRIAIALASGGNKLIGIDISERMLAQAKKKIEGLDSSIKHRISLIRADMRDYKLNTAVDFAYSGFRSFMLLTDQEDQVRALTNALLHLNKGGRLAIDLIVPTVQSLMKYKNQAPDEYQYRREFKSPTGKGRILEFENRSCDEHRQIATYRLKHVTLDDTGEELDSTERVLIMRWTYKFEFQALARYCGFEIEGVYGDYEFGCLDEASSEMIWILKKPA